MQLDLTTPVTIPDIQSESIQAYVDLSRYSNGDYSPGRNRIVRCLWYFVSLLLFENGFVPLMKPKIWLLRMFGARIGEGLIIKPGVLIKFPWRLAVGKHCWIGQGVWIDNLAKVSIGDHACLSQGAYLCTGSHDYLSHTFRLITKPISIGAGAWVGSRSIILGTVIGPNAVVAAGSVVTKDVAPASVVGGNPAQSIARTRVPPLHP